MMMQNISCVANALRYERLKADANNAKVVMIKPRKRCWLKRMRMKGGVKGVRLSRSRKLIMKAFSVVVLAGRMAKLYADIVERMKMDGFCPNIIFSTQWGFPVLSHPKSRPHFVF